MTSNPRPSRARRGGLRVATTSLAAAAAVGTGALTWSVTHAATAATSAVTADGSSSTPSSDTSGSGTSTSGTSSSGVSSLPAGDSGQADASSGGS